MVKVSCPVSIKYNGVLYKPSEAIVIEDKDLPEFKEKHGASVLQEVVNKKDVKAPEVKETKKEKQEKPKYFEDKKNGEKE